MILVETSAWVEYDRASGSEVHRRLSALIRDEAPIAVTEPVVMEVIAGARDDAREAQLRRLLARCALVPFDSSADFDGAARVYRRCRAAGITPRGLLDCCVAAVAIRHGVPLLAQDRDYVQMAEVMALSLDPATTAAK